MTMANVAARTGTPTLVAALLLLASTSVWAWDRHGHHHGHHWHHVGVCSATAKTLLSACGYDAGDNYLTAVATCKNLTDEGDREECFADARDTRSEDGQECDDVHDARLDVCDSLGEDAYDPEFDPENFESPMVNPYFPLVVGNQWKYRSKYMDEDDEGNDISVVERDTVTVTDRTKLIEDVTCMVVTDVVRIRVDGELAGVEKTEDWYANDDEGNVWYCGESSQDLEVFDGDEPPNPELVSIDGSWKTGREGAKPGIVMFAAPVEDTTYRQELFWTEAEDVADVIAVGTNVEAGDGGEVSDYECTDNKCLETRDYTALEPDAEEHKYYLPGTGLILEVDQTNGARNELIEFTPGAP